VAFVLVMAGVLVVPGLSTVVGMLVVALMPVAAGVGGVAGMLVVAGVPLAVVLSVPHLTPSIIDQVAFRRFDTRLISEDGPTFIGTPEDSSVRSTAIPQWLTAGLP
jgi:hypothetical protein